MARRIASKGMLLMAKKYYFLALAALLLIPVVTVVGGSIAVAINPEIAAGHANYERNFRLLGTLKIFAIWATFFIDFCLWTLCCAFLLKARARSMWWLPLALLGPLGLAALAALNNRASDGGDPYQRMTGGMNPLLRIVYEIGSFVVIWFAAFEAMETWRYLSIAAESMRTGVPIAAIVEQRNASGGMWAFTEGNEVLFIAALLYLLRPIFVNAAGCFGKSWLSRRA
jgi:hypothetical protein